MIFALSTTAFADESTPTISVSKTDENTYIVDSKDGIEQLTITEDDTTRKITVNNSTTGNKYYLILNKVDGSIYSSITNKTVSKNKQAPIITPRSETSYSTVSISWAEFKDTLGTVSTAGGLISLVLAKVPGAQPEAGVIGTISTIMGGIAWVFPNDTDHGLKFKIKTEKFYRTRLGQRHLWKTTNTITSVSRY